MVSLKLIDVIPETYYSPDILIRVLHLRGINCRYLGLVYAHLTCPVWRERVLVEMVSRSVKVYLRQELRATMKRERVAASEPYRRTLARVMNKVFSKQTGKRLWGNELPELLRNKFSFPDISELQARADAARQLVLGPDCESRPIVPAAALAHLRDLAGVNDSVFEDQLEQGGANDANLGPGRPGWGRPDFMRSVSTRRVGDPAEPRPPRSTGSGSSASVSVPGWGTPTQTPSSTGPRGAWGVPAAAPSNLASGSSFSGALSIGGTSSRQHNGYDPPIQSQRAPTPSVPRVTRAISSSPSTPSTPDTGRRQSDAGSRAVYDTTDMTNLSDMPAASPLLKRLLQGLPQDLQHSVHISSSQHWARLVADSGDDDRSSVASSTASNAPSTPRRGSRSGSGVYGPRHGGSGSGNSTFFPPDSTSLMRRQSSWATMLTTEGGETVRSARSTHVHSATPPGGDAWNLARDDEDEEGGSDDRGLAEEGEPEPGMSVLADPITVRDSLPTAALLARVCDLAGVKLSEGLVRDVFDDIDAVMTPSTPFDELNFEDEEAKVKQTPLLRYAQGSALFILSRSKDKSRDSKRLANQAKAAFDAALAMCPTHAATLANYGFLAEDQLANRAMAAQKYVLAVHSSRGRHTRSCYYLALHLQRTTKWYDEAEVLFQQAVQNDPTHANCRKDYGMFLKRVRHKYKEAEALWIEVLRLDPLHLQALKQLSISRRHGKDFPNSYRIMRRILAHFSVHDGGLLVYAEFLGQLLGACRRSRSNGIIPANIAKIRDLQLPPVLRADGSDFDDDWQEDWRALCGPQAVEMELERVMRVLYTWLTTDRHEAGEVFQHTIADGATQTQTQGRGSGVDATGTIGNAGQTESSHNSVTSPRRSSRRLQSRMADVIARCKVGELLCGLAKHATKKPADNSRVHDLAHSALQVAAAVSPATVVSVSKLYMSLKPPSVGLAYDVLSRGVSQWPVSVARGPKGLQKGNDYTRERERISQLYHETAKFMEEHGATCRSFESSGPRPPTIFNIPALLQQAFAAAPWSHTIAADLIRRARAGQTIALDMPVAATSEVSYAEKARARRTPAKAVESKIKEMYQAGRANYFQWMNRHARGPSEQVDCELLDMPVPEGRDRQRGNTNNGGGGGGGGGDPPSAGQANRGERSREPVLQREQPPNLTRRISWRDLAAQRPASNAPVPAAAQPPVMASSSQPVPNQRRHRQRRSQAP